MITHQSIAQQPAQPEPFVSAKAEKAGEWEQAQYDTLQAAESRNAYAQQKQNQQNFYKAMARTQGLS